MFDRNKCFKTITEVNSFNEREKELIASQIKLQEKKIKFQRECNHDLILCCCIDFGVQTSRKGKCIICGKDYVLFDDYDLISSRKVNSHSIIYLNDIVDNPSELDLNSWYLLAKGMLQLILAENKDLSLNEVKMRIINYLIFEERELKVKKLAKVKID